MGYLWVNSGALLQGMQFRNSGTLTGSGTVGGATVHNFGQIQANGGTLTIAGNLINGGQLSGSTSGDCISVQGDVEMVDDTGSLTGGALVVAGNEYVGRYSDATFTQSGGSHTVASQLILGYTQGVLGTYNLTGGQLTTPAGAGQHPQRHLHRIQRKWPIHPNRRSA